MGETLPVRAHFVLAFHDQHAALAQHPVRLLSRVFIQRQYRVVVLLRRLVSGTVVPIVPLERRVHRVGTPAGRVHVGRVQHHAIDPAVVIRQVAAVRTGLNVRCEPDVAVLRHMTPEHAFAVGDVGDGGALGNVEGQDPREHGLVAARVGAEDQVVGRYAVADDPATLLRPMPGWLVRGAAAHEPPPAPASRFDVPRLPDFPQPGSGSHASCRRAPRRTRPVRGHPRPPRARPRGFVPDRRAQAAPPPKHASTACRQAAEGRSKYTPRRMPAAGSMPRTKR